VLFGGGVTGDGDGDGVGDDGNGGSGLFAKRTERQKETAANLDKHQQRKKKQQQQQRKKKAPAKNRKTTSKVPSAAVVTAASGTADVDTDDDLSSYMAFAELEWTACTAEGEVVVDTWLVDGRGRITGYGSQGTVGG
jgi:hypothetical protein